MSAVARAVVFVAAAFAAVSLLTACAAPDARASAPSPSSAPTVAAGEPSGEPAGDPVALVGLWRVSGAVGEGSETWLRLGAGELVLWRECGILHGAWTAADRAFLAQIFGWSGSCSMDSPVVPWLDAAASYRAAGDGWQLLDPEGRVVASLAIDGAPQPIDTADPSFAETPVIDERVRASFADVPPLPAGLRPATSADLAGRWIPAGISVSTDPHVEFMAGRAWRGSDGCNGQAARWTLESDGRMLTTGGLSTSIGCEGADVPGWVSGTRLVGFEGAELVLLDRDAVELGRLVRERAEAP
ncbi:hypothetical protein BJ978_001061 [Agromyces terreus]|uniref:META domain-containing protein n=1 Tax=Agromyces terreus TaxID=424795 RepID=A0A9X2H075_9MICO|nr:hypothetical protein [Agromyces terreus]MCP2370385.1 hypothetical protein [Agromyces terreus]